MGNLASGLSTHYAKVSPRFWMGETLTRRRAVQSQQIQCSVKNILSPLGLIEVQKGGPPSEISKTTLNRWKGRDGAQTV